jgi:PAS domain S-box-containing protein
MAETSTELFVRLVRQARPLRHLSVWTRYALATVIVLVCFAIRHALEGVYPYPYLLFLPGILLTSLLLDRGSGFWATALSAALALYFFVEPERRLYPIHAGDALSVGVFTAVGFLTAGVVEALRNTVDDLATANRALEESRRDLGQSLGILEAVFEATPDPMCVKDVDGRYLRVNAALARVLGVSASSLLGKPVPDPVGEAFGARLLPLERQVLQAGGAYSGEVLADLPTDGTRWYLATVAPWFRPGGARAGLIEVLRDVQQRKVAEMQVEGANAQKALLLRDINHRIKNHLQSLAALLAMSRKSLRDPQAREAIDGAANRVMVLARVYDRLELRSEGDVRLSLRDFVEQLCTDLRPMLLDLRPLALHVRVADREIDMSRAVLVGLVVNEALTNAAKYAFPDGRPGSITVAVTAVGRDLKLVVEDDGIGVLPDRFGSGTGTRLIRSLAQQLGGSFTISTPPGTRIEITFPEGADDDSAAPILAGAAPQDGEDAKSVSRSGFLPR